MNIYVIYRQHYWCPRTCVIDFNLVYIIIVFTIYLSGLPEDAVSARDLYKKAAELGNEAAQQRLDEIKAQEKIANWQGKYMLNVEMTNRLW